MSSKQSALSRLIGQNAKTFRLTAKITLDEFAVFARQHGLPWSESRVADFEAGRAAPSIPTLIAVCMALAEAGCYDVTVAALLTTNEPVELNDRLTVDGSLLSAWLAGKPVEPQHVSDAVMRRDLRVPVTNKAGNTQLRTVQREASIQRLSTAATILAASGSAEERARKKLGLSKRGLAEVCAVTWGRSFSQERDARAGDGANAQRRGSITRQLQSELQEILDRGDDR
ncbi:helix-turn-helix transcriptional regulator [Rhodococcus sp. BP-332]|uniref:helix-turn-helix domain-containing protein n=1 Tax=Rhodococcus sp. BP-332 TaxID=2739447 RepID=UPI001C9B1041|nr:helix-turn-helix transcriptional regulator [Rhodococcus sp. BP-332]MBY6678335.1 helix-turn-helix transcriptional regulator [Rhodococcus sp. BP-332]